MAVINSIRHGQWGWYCFSIPNRNSCQAIAPGLPPEMRPNRGLRPPGRSRIFHTGWKLWNEARTAVEQVLAITANASIGYSAFYAAARDHFDRYITLRHKNTIVNRWNGPAH